MGPEEGLYLGVFDGHGSEGRSVSQTICSRVPKLLAQNPMFKVRLAEGRRTLCLMSA